MKKLQMTKIALFALPAFVLFFSGIVSAGPLLPTQNVEGNIVTL